MIRLKRVDGTVTLTMVYEFHPSDLITDAEEGVEVDEEDIPELVNTQIENVLETMFQHVYANLGMGVTNLYQVPESAEYTIEEEA
jgi:hypothetical protein